VRDALEAWARRSGAEIRLASGVSGIERCAASGALPARWRVRCDGATLEAEELVLATGGQSYPKSGTTGEGYAWLARLGLPLAPPVPALVPLVSPAAWARELTGIALQDVEARLVDASGRVLGRRARPVVFTHHGVSGPGAMDLSEPVARAGAEARAAGCEPPVHQLLLDLAPALEREELRARLVAAAAQPGQPRLARAVAELASEPLPRRLVQAVLDRAGVEGDERPAAQLRKAERHALVETLKGLPVPVHDTRGFELAEVTAGGLSLDALDPRSMRVNALPGLFVIGELLDRAGPIGGLNFQAAFAEAELAARARG
jgi:predicted Rossmann fold flavoprotein